MRWLIFLVLLLAVPAGAADITLDPRAVENGGVAMLRWEGPLPATAVARFNGRDIDLQPGPRGLTALLGVDLRITSYNVCYTKLLRLFALDA